MNRLDRARSFGSLAVALVVLAAGAYAGCSSDGGAGASASDAGTPLGSNEGDAASVGPGEDAGTAGDDATIAIDAASSGGDDATINLDEGGATDATTLDGEVDASLDAGHDATTDAGHDAGHDAGIDAGHDAGVDASAHDSGPDASSAVDCSPSAGGSIGASGAPKLLACTGLYADWGTQTIASTAVAYDPGLHLWSDGAVKRRFIALPPGAKIDSSDMDEWTFPVGTKVWKEFALGGKKIETRYLEKTSTSHWVWTTYQWSSDQTTATELTTGATNVNGTGYEIPYLDECRTCHQGRLDFVLGFEAIALSTSAATGITMSSLVAGGRLTNAPSAPLVIPGDATASAALGWLHANCGTACHNPSKYALAGSTGFFMRLESTKLASVQATNTYATGVNVQAKFKEPDGGTLMRIAPGNPTGSCVVFRDSYRDTQGEGIQMPPMDSHVVDTADVGVVKSWIGTL